MDPLHKKMDGQRRSEEADSDFFTFSSHDENRKPRLLRKIMENDSVCS